MPINSENYTELWELIQPLVAKKIKNRKKDACRKSSFIFMLDVLHMHSPRDHFCLSLFVREKNKQSSWGASAMCHVYPTAEWSLAGRPWLSVGRTLGEATQIHVEKQTHPWEAFSVGSWPGSCFQITREHTTFWCVFFRSGLHYAIQLGKGGTESSPWFAYKGAHSCAT